MSPHHSLLRRQLKRHFSDPSAIPESWRAFVDDVNCAYVEFDTDREMLEHSLELSSQELLDANSELRAVFQAIPDLVLRIGQDGVILDAKAGIASDLTVARNELIGKTVQQTPLRDTGQRLPDAIETVIAQRVPASVEYAASHGAEATYFEARLVPLQDAQLVIIIRNISARMQGEAELTTVHQQLVDASRQAGMAEIATNVLHNVGNVLNSVNVSAGLVAQSVRRSRVVNLAKVVGLLRAHEDDLESFLRSDRKGRQLPEYLARLSAHLEAEQKAALDEIASLQMNIGHIKAIVAMQQDHASGAGTREWTSIRELLEDGLRMNASRLELLGIEVVREFEDVPPVHIDKHKLLQIIVNLLRNAKRACEESGRPDKTVTLRLADAGGRIRICVSDNGVGIASENMVRIFQHGFTTRKDGHGFGLHSGAIAAREMGGSLAVASDGPGCGATLTLELPTSTSERLP